MNAPRFSLDEGLARFVSWHCTPDGPGPLTSDDIRQLFDLARDSWRVIKAPDGARIDLLASTVSYKWVLTLVAGGNLDDESAPRLTLNTAWTSLDLIGDPEAPYTAAAAYAILEEAVSAGNALLDEIAAFAAAGGVQRFTTGQAPHPTAPGDLPVTAELRPGDEGKNVAVVEVGDDEVNEVLVHQSLLDPGRVNVEINGDFTGGRGLTVYVNDRSVFDSVNT